MSFLVTGGAGFIGSNIVIELVKQGFEVKVIDNLATGNIKNLDSVKNEIEFIKGDICDLDLKKSFEGVDFILHQAAIPSVQRSIENPFASLKANAEGTLKVLIAACDYGVKKVVYASSSSVYGDIEELPKRESMRSKPISPYALTKFAGEEYCGLFSRLYGLETVSLRYFNVFGPNQNSESDYAAVIPKFIKYVLNDRQPVIYGDGKQSRDFTFVGNVVKANLLACKAKKPDTVMNIACGKRYDLLELVKKINEILGKDIKPIFSDPRKGDIKHSLADISKAGESMGYRPEFSFEEGLKRTVNFFIENE